MTALVREAWAAARSQGVASSLTCLLVAAVVVAITLTSGRTVAAQQEVLRSIDSVGTRAIVVRADTDSGLTTGFLQRLRAVDQIAWLGGLSPIVDGRNAGVPDAAGVPVRQLYSDDLRAAGMPAQPVSHTAYASATALDALGMPYGVGELSLTNGDTLGVAPAAGPAPALLEFEPLVLVPATPHGDEPLAVVVVIAASPDMVAPLTPVVTSLLALDDPRMATVSTSSDLAELRSLVEAQMSALSRSLIVGLVGVAAVLVAALQTALVLMRRKDFGRRRALGASRGFIVALQLTQTALLVLVGAAAGVMASGVVLAVTGAPQPGVRFSLAVTIWTLTFALIASLAPAILASRRDPATELRVP